MKVTTTNNVISIFKYQEEDFKQLQALCHSIQSHIYPLYITKDKDEIYIFNLNGWLQTDAISVLDLSWFEYLNHQEILERLERK